MTDPAQALRPDWNLL